MSACSSAYGAARSSATPRGGPTRPPLRLLAVDRAGAAPLLCSPPAAFNDPFIDAEYAAYMFKYDTVVRRAGGDGQG